MSITDLIFKRNRIDHQQKQILSRCEREHRGMTSEEEEQYDRLDLEFVELDEQIRRAERASKSELIEEPVRPDPQDSLGDIEYRGAGGRIDYSAIKPNPATLNRDLERLGEYYVTGQVPNELRTLFVGDSGAGGYLTLPTSITADIIHELDDTVFMRTIARRFPNLRADAQGLPVMESDLGDAQWKSEISEADLDTQLQFEQRRLTPRRCAEAVKISRHLLNVGLPNVASFIHDRLIYKMQITLEKAYLVGDGTNKPLGVFTEDESGVDSSRNVSTGNTTTQIKGDGLIEALYTLKSQYHRRGRWIFHRDALKMIRKLKSGDGDYVWQAGLGQDRPSTILGLPYMLSEYAPNTFTTGKRVGLVGDFSFYGIVDANPGLQVQVLTEKFALENCNAYVSNLFTDGMPLLSTAFVAVTLA